MSNALLSSNLLTDTEILVDPGTTLDGYPGENLRVFQPGVSMRESVLTSNHTLALYREFGTIYADTVALIGTNLNAFPNLLLSANDMSDSGEWDVTNASVAAATGATNIAGTTRIWRLTESGTGEHYIQQEWVPPTSQNSDLQHQYSDSMTFSVYAKNPRNIRIRVAQGSDYAYQDFNMGTGAKNGTVQTSGFTATSAISFEQLGFAGSWYRLSVSVSNGMDTVVGGNVVARVQLLDGSFNASYASTGSYSDMIAPQMEIASAASTYAPTEDETGAQWRVRVLDAGGASTDWVYESAWMPVSATDRTEQQSNLGFSNMKYRIAAPVASAQWSVFYRDPSNADGYVEIGTAVLGLSFQPDINIAAGHSVTWAEEGSSTRSMGGQLYRPQNSVYRMVSMEHQFLTEAEAYESAFALQRRVGRSRGVLVSVDPDGTYSNETTIWGLLDSPSPLIRRAYSSTLGGNVYQTTWEVIEALP